MPNLMMDMSMRTTLTVDDELFAKAVALAEPGIERSELLKECIKAFILFIKLLQMQA